MVTKTLTTIESSHELPKLTSRLNTLSKAQQKRPKFQEKKNKEGWGQGAAKDFQVPTRSDVKLERGGNNGLRAL